ncbi:UNVERIFIED_ORG: kynurenine formamidase [Rahnella aquatilis]
MISMSILNLYSELKSHTWVDLSHNVDENAPLWEGFPAYKREILYTHQENGFQAEVFSHVGQCGTHIDSPNHFIKDGLALHELPLEDFILPLCVIDVVDKVQSDNNYELQIEDIIMWENKYGKIPNNAFVAMRTNWSKRWPSKQNLANYINGEKQSPGWSVESIDWLCAHRKIGAIGHETLDTDSGYKSSRGDFSSEFSILQKNKFQIELMTNLDAVDEFGSIIIIGAPKFKYATGFPARVFAIKPSKLSVNGD